jgi:cysteinyl-tRNA synthetase
VLRLYNTLTREKEVFKPLDAKNVRMYVCGPTVYDFAHIGNARPVIVFDVLYRLLRHIYGSEHVTYVRNITDVDDKINARAAQDYPDLPLNEAIRRVTEKTEAQFHADMAALGALDPTVEPRATEHIAEMKAIIECLVANGCAYEAKNHVLFRVGVSPDYGELSRRSRDEMIAGSRVEVAPFKIDPMDFVLWKPSKPGEPSWPSPAEIEVPGRPGWHIECSAMADRWLWENAKPKLSQAGLSKPHMFDIHGGGIDLVFPHHENEIAQSRCAFQTPTMAQVWMHNGFLQVEGEKMAKSLGNFVTVHELLSDWHGRAWPGNAVRLAMLGVHYRQPLNWTFDRLAEAEKELFLVTGEFLNLSQRRFKNEVGPFAEWLKFAPREVDGEFLDALSDDLNTPFLFSLLRSKYQQVGNDLRSAESVLATLEFLGVLDRETLFLNASPVLRGFFDREAIQGGFWIGRKLQVGLLNRDERLIDEAKSLLSQWKIRHQFGPGKMLFLDRESADASAGRARVAELVEARAQARAAKDFKEADRIRDELAAMGITLKDAKDPKTGELTTTWEVAR